MPNNAQGLRKQIADDVSASANHVEKLIADCLINDGEFRAAIDGDTLGFVLRKVLYTLVGEQKVAQIDLPIVHNVSEMVVNIAGGEAKIAATVHIHQPITAFIKFRYTLENDPRTSKRLRLKNNKIDVEEVTRAFDVGAKVALKVMGVERIARTELSNPNAIIARTLPPQLAPHGYAGKLERVELEFNDDCLEVVLSPA
ncbi:MAG: hypothetical protein IAE80_15285 [Anaerolinea sp.]|nr:hypothetical protein [Anaerolinea sp.]